MGLDYNIATNYMDSTFYQSINVNTALSVFEHQFASHV